MNPLPDEETRALTSAASLSPCYPKGSLSCVAAREGAGGSPLKNSRCRSVCAMRLTGQGCANQIFNSYVQRDASDLGESGQHRRHDHRERHGAALAAGSAWRPMLPKREN